MCKSEVGSCFSEVVDPDQRGGSQQDVYKNRHGCIELLEDKYVEKYESFLINPVRLKKIMHGNCVIKDRSIVFSVWNCDKSMNHTIQGERREGSAEAPIGATGTEPKWIDGSVRWPHTVLL